MANWRGTWGSGTAYAADDSVTYGGAPYYCVTANTGHTPGTDADWAVMDSFTGPGAVVDHVTVTGTATSGQVITATSASAANWQTPAAGVALDSTAGDIKALGSQAAGSGTTAARGDHVHPSTGVVLTSSLPLAIGSGGTGQATAAAAITALTGSQTAGKVLRSDGTNTTLSSIQAGDVPTLNQNSSGTAAGLSATLAVGSGGTGQTSAGAAFNALSPNTTLGDVTYGNGTNTSTRLAGSTSATKQYLQQTGNGSVSAAPAWGGIAAGDVPTLNQSTSGSAASLSATLAIASGGTNATTAAGALTSLGAAALAGATFTGWEAPAVVALTDAATIAVNAAAGNDQRVTLGGNRTLGAPSNPVDGQQVLFQITQDGTGSRTLAYTSGAGGYSFSAQLPSPTLSIAAGAVDLLKFVYNLAKNRWLFIAYLGGF
jgi:hypothetical protein